MHCKIFEENNNMKRIKLEVFTTSAPAERHHELWRHILQCLFPPHAHAHNVNIGTSEDRSNVSEIFFPLNGVQHL